LPPLIRQVGPAVGHRHHDGVVLAPIRSCSTQGPRKHCTPLGS
jgi:hypothetical protein